MTNELEIRKANFEAESIDIEKREVTGRAVPYGETANIGDFQERFEPGSIIPDDRGIRLRYEHGETIGIVSATEDREDGFYITARFADTQRARETLALLQVGALRDFSIGFIPLEGGTRDEDGVLVRTAVDLREVSVVTFPAYAGANITEVRKEDSTSNEIGDIQMTENTVNAADVEEIRANYEDLERRFNLLNSDKDADNTGASFRSAGALLKALAEGDETALRAYTGATTADSTVKNAWVGDLTRLVEGATTLYTLFSKGALPKEGNFIEYGVLKSNSVAVSAQGGEGEDLVTGKLEFETKTAPVDTRGGYVSLSRQAIERSSINVLDHTLRALAIELGKDVERVTRAAVNSALATQSANAVTVADGDLWEDWQEAIVDAAVKFKANGLSMDALVVSTDVFKRLGAIKASDGRPVFDTNNDGSNTIGDLRVKTLTGEIFSVTVVLDPLAANGKAYFANTEAVRVYTNPVTRLQDENIINLTKDFSLYQYIAVAPEIPVGLVPVTITA